MLRDPRPLIALFLVGVVLVPGARAQIPYNLSYDYYPRITYAPLGYQLYGWSGWGVPPQMQNELARGMALYAQQAALARTATRQADARQRREEMVRRWNTFFWAAQHALNLARVGGRLPETGSDAAALEAELARLRDRPEPAEIESGAALNALLDQFTDPRLPAAAIRGARTRLDSRLIRQVPYEYASEIITILLERLTNDDRWPRLLAIPALVGPRQALRDAIGAAVTEDQRGPLTEAAVGAVHVALRDLAKEVVGALPPGSPPLAAAEAYLKELTGLARLLGRPDVAPVLGALDEQTETTVEDLIAFMTMFNLRFGEATTPAQAGVYRALYPILSRWRSDLRRRLGGRLPQGGVTLAGLRQQAAPSLLAFATMSWDELLGRPTADGPDPRR
jgi:hypothetical protein